MEPSEATNFKANLLAQDSGQWRHHLQEKRGQFFFKEKKDLFILREREKEGKREGEKHGREKHGLVSLTHPKLGTPGLQPRHVP